MKNLNLSALMTLFMPPFPSPVIYIQAAAVKLLTVGEIAVKLTYLLTPSKLPPLWYFAVVVEALLTAVPWTEFPLESTTSFAVPFQLDSSIFQYPTSQLDNASEF